MLCEHCKERDAVVHLTRIVENTVTQLHLCEKCAAEKGVETSAPHPLGDILQAVQQQAELSAAQAGPEAEEVDRGVCAFCGATARDFRATGRLGCAHCWDANAASLRDLVQRLHGARKHTGRRYEPPRPETLQEADARGELRDRLRRAVESEQFELAAELRDRLKVMEP